MNAQVSKAMSAIDLTYAELIGMAEDVFSATAGELDKLIEYAYSNVENMSNDMIRDLMIKLSLRTYSFSEIKEKSAFKATLAETIRKESYARTFNNTEGTVSLRENTAIISSSAEILAEEIHMLLSNMLKTKLDEAHRIVNTLQSVLVSRMQEAKLSSIDIQ